MDSYTIVTRISPALSLSLGSMTEAEARERYDRTVPRPGHTVQFVRVLTVERGMPMNWEMVEEKKGE